MIATNTYYNEHILASVQEEDMQLSFALAQPSVINTTEDKATLGQVFTLPKVAVFMVKLLKKKNIDHFKILDPCIGPNSFPKQIASFLPDAHIKGIEIDKSLITSDINNFYKKENRILLEGSFFDLPISEKFDAIIQNPPYVRHELLIKGANNKERITQSISSLDLSVPPKANLYIYFLLKSLLHLKEGGKLVAITYDSWLYSEFGEHLKKTLLQFGQVDAIYHFKKNAFPDANVGATIIEFTKNSNAIALKKNIDIYQFETAEDLSRYELKPTQKLSKKAFLNFKGNLKSTLDFENDLFCALEKLSAIKPFRGLGTIANQYFIFDTPCYEATIPYIKEVTKIEEMTVSEASKYLLCVNGHKSDALEKYIEQVEVEVKNNTNLLTLKNAISKNATWYKIAPRQTGNLIFNYYLRKNIDFILNINELQVSDNFYILNVKENLFAKFAILNATFSKLAIFEHSRNQGSGLRKIQVFEFLKVPILNLDKLDNTTIVELEILGQALSQAKRLNGEKEIIIEKIDIVLLKTYNKMLNKSLTLSALQADYQKIVANC